MTLWQKPAVVLALPVGYKLTRKAEEDFIQIYLTGIAEFGEVVAEKYQAGLRAAFEFLSEYPYAARERDEISPPVRAHPHKSHLVVYIIEGNDILILGIRHGREDWVSNDHLS